MNSMDLAGLEKNIFSQTKQDGAMETILGFAMLFIGLSKLLDTNDVFRSIIPLFVIIFILVWKRRITLPRLGYVEFSKERRTRTKLAIFTMMFVSFATVALVLWGVHIIENTSSVAPATVKITKRLLSGGMLAAIIAAVAFFMDLKHLYFFAGFSFLMFVVISLFNLPSGYAFIGLGIAFLIFGLIRLQRFLKAYPLPETPENV